MKYHFEGLTIGLLIFWGLTLLEFFLGEIKFTFPTGNFTTLILYFIVPFLFWVLWSMLRRSK